MPNPVTAPPGTPATPASSSNVLQIPTVPTATDLPSALVAINVIGQAIAQIANAFGNIPTAVAAARNTTAATGGPFTKVSETTATVVLEDPNDSTVQVEITQVTELIMKNNTTGETWIWTI